MADNDHHDQDTRRDPLLPLRTAVLLLLSLLSGAAAGVLTVLAGGHTAGAVLIGAGTTAAAIKFFDWFIN